MMPHPAPGLKPVVEDVVNKYLDCGDLTKGFARIYCENCKKSMLLPFSCKGRGPGTDNARRGRALERPAKLQSLGNPAAAVRRPFEPLIPP